MSTPKNYHVNTEWFRIALMRKKLSQRGLARLMGEDPASVSRTLNGYREPTARDAAAYSIFLGQSVVDVLKNLGAYGREQWTEIQL